jgi:hypothetical protein
LSNGDLRLSRSLQSILRDFVPLITLPLKASKHAPDPSSAYATAITEKQQICTIRSAKLCRTVAFRQQKLKGNRTSDHKKKSGLFSVHAAELAHSGV